MTKNQINIADLLKDCPKGMELDCLIYENVTLVQVKEGYDYPIVIETPNGQMLLSKYGGFSKNELAKCIIFPKGKTTWEGFHKPFEDGDIVAFDAYHLQIFIFKDKKENNTLSNCYLMLDVDGDELYLEDGMYYVTRFATEEEKKKLFDAIKKHGYKWNADSKTLEELPKPKFKVGDEYELVPDKFDISTLKPFESKVLVRHNKDNKWCASFFSHIDGNLHSHCYKYVTVAGKSYPMCIPYEENQHLLGTTNDCDEYFKNW